MGRTRAKCRCLRSGSTVVVFLKVLCVSSHQLFYQRTSFDFFQLFCFKTKDSVL